MTVFSSSLSSARARRQTGHLFPIIAGVGLGLAAIAFVAYLLWPTWRTESAGEPGQLPVSVGGTLFNVPTDAVRMKIQRHSGPQERIDLAFDYPSLTPPLAPKHITAEMVDEAVQPVDRIFLSIAAHHDALSPETRLRTIYPRYLADSATQLESGLSMRAFRDGTPYGGEDLFSAASPLLNARCMRDAETPGMCLSERRVGGADLTFRFPRSWLSQWREVADALEHLTAQLHGAH
ncbi:MAG TPA: hypothetical protein VKY22_15725 [Bradyrhizobium sp.]|nr:hypothetical protein [Bradyrhizobium sp.]